MDDIQPSVQVLLLNSRQNEFATIVELLAKINSNQSLPCAIELLYTKQVEKGLEVLKDNKIDVVLLDLSSSKKSAIACLEKLKRGISHKIPIITLISDYDEDFTQSAIKNGASYSLALNDLEDEGLAKSLKLALNL